MADAQTLSLLQRINELKLLPRTGWLFAGISNPESIADHSAATALLTLLLAESVNSDLATHQLERPLDVGRAVQIAIVHDLAESVLTDLPKRSSELIGETVKHDAERTALQQMFAAHPAGEKIMQYWLEYSDASTPEGQLVRDVDKLEMIHQALRYERAGNRNLNDFFRSHRWHFSISQSLYNALYTSRS